MKRRVTCSVPDGTDLDRRLDAIGGAGWQHDIDRAIAEIENAFGDRYYVLVAGASETNVIVAKRRNGVKYLKTEADGEEPNNLTKLPKCP